MEEGCVCACVVAVHVRVCVHIHVLVSMAAADQAWRALQGPPLVRLPALNGASGRFPLSLSSPSPPPGWPLSWFPSTGLLHSFGRSESRPHQVCTALPKSKSQGGERLQLPVPGVSMEGSGLLLLASPGREGEGSFPGEAKALDSLPPLPAPWSLPSPHHVSCAALQGASFLTKHCCSSGPGRRLPGWGPAG